MKTVRDAAFFVCLILLLPLAVLAKWVRSLSSREIEPESARGHAVQPDSGKGEPKIDARHVGVTPKPWSQETWE
jgi:hypothetical protein